MERYEGIFWLKKVDYIRQNVDLIRIKTEEIIKKSE